MAVKLNRTSYEHARNLIARGKAVHDERDAWSEHQPTAQEENEFIEKHGFAEYQKWFLGIDEDEGEHTKSRYKFPYGDFENVHRCAVITIESRAGKYNHTDIDMADANRTGMLNAANSAS